MIDAGPVGGRQARDLLAADLDHAGWASSAAVTAAEKPSRSTASAPPAGRRCASAAAHDQRAGAAHLLMEQADGVVLRIVRAEGIGADQFGQAVGLVGIGAADGAHLMQHHRGAGLRRSPGRFRARQSAADDVDGVWQFPLQVFDWVQRKPEDCFRVLGRFRLPPLPPKNIPNNYISRGKEALGRTSIRPARRCNPARARVWNHMGTVGAGFKGAAPSALTTSG